MKITITILDNPTPQQPQGVELFLGFDEVLTHAVAQRPTPAMNVAAALIRSINPHLAWEAHVPH